MVAGRYRMAERSRVKLYRIEYEVEAEDKEEALNAIPDIEPSRIELLEDDEEKE